MGHVSGGNCHYESAVDDKGEWAIVQLKAGKVDMRLELWGKGIRTKVGFVSGI